jgi:hypothetical protein|tara:strand:+ start:138 stop:353 length:216 start_codon:yes stop_codon:yes gene_type:complete
MIIDLPKNTGMTVYFPDGTRLLISSKEDDIRVEHVSPALDQVINYFTASLLPNGQENPPSPPVISNDGSTG